MRKAFFVVPLSILVPLVAATALFSSRLCGCTQGDEGFRMKVGADPMKDSAEFRQAFLRRFPAGTPARVFQTCFTPDTPMSEMLAFKGNDCPWSPGSHCEVQDSSRRIAYRCLVSRSGLGLFQQGFSAELVLDDKRNIIDFQSAKFRDWF